MIAFTKMESLGNDFVLLHKPKSVLAFEKLANRRYGVGCDQIIVLEDSNIADIRVLFFNQNGSSAAICGNGLRAVIQFLEKSVSMETISGIKHGWLEKQEPTVLLGVPHYVQRFDPPLCDYGYGSVINIGNQHCIFYTELDITDKQLNYYGKYIESYFSDGINVSFVRRIESTHIRLRVWERGVGITPACGSAAAAACFDLSVKAMRTVHMDGGDLVCYMTEDGLIQKGKVSICFTGYWYD